MIEGIKKSISVFITVLFIFLEAHVQRQSSNGGQTKLDPSNEEISKGKIHKHILISISFQSENKSF